MHQQQRSRRPLKPFDRAVLRLIGWLAAIGFAAGVTGAFTTGNAGDAVLGVALLAFGLAFPQLVLRIGRRY